MSFTLVLGAQASTIQKASFNKVLNQAQLVFEGRVISRETRIASRDADPFTFFTFEILDVIKGNYASPTIELGFMGGLKNGRQLIITDMIMPALGEQGIYFVESLHRQQINPLFGWDQGHYLVQFQGNGESPIVVPRVMGADSMGAAISLEHFKKRLRNTLELTK